MNKSEVRRARLEFFLSLIIIAVIVIGAAWGVTQLIPNTERLSADVLSIHVHSDSPATSLRIQVNTVTSLEEARYYSAGNVYDVVVDGHNGRLAATLEVGDVISVECNRYRVCEKLILEGQR